MSTKMLLFFNVHDFQKKQNSNNLEQLGRNQPLSRRGMSAKKGGWGVVTGIKTFANANPKILPIPAKPSRRTVFEQTKASAGNQEGRKMSSLERPKPQNSLG